MYGFEYPQNYIMLCEFWHFLAGLVFGGCFLTSIILLMGRDVRRIFRSPSVLVFSLLGLAFIASLSHYLADILGWGF